MVRRKVTKNHRNFTIERPLNIGDATRDSEITELEQYLLELQHHLLELKHIILRWSKQDIEKSHKDSAEERYILYTCAKSIIDKKQRRVNLLRALVYA